MGVKRSKTRKKDQKGDPKKLVTLEDTSTKPVYRTVKFTLKKLRRQQDAEKIENAVRTCHHVATLTLDFAKLYLQHLYTRGIDFPTLDATFYHTIIRVITKRKRSGGRPITTNIELYGELSSFYTEYFLPLSPKGNKRVEVENLSHVFAYMAQSMEVTQLTNITRCFPAYIKKYVNAYFLQKLHDERGAEYQMTKQEKSAFYGQLRHVKEDILFHRRWSEEGYKSLPQYHEFLNDCVGVLIPEPVSPPSEWGVYQDVRLQPYKYLKYMVDMNIQFELEGVKTYSPFCLRSSLSPRYIKLDTAAIIDLLITDEDIRDLSVILNMPRLTNKNQLLGSLDKLTGKKTTKKEGFFFNTSIWKHIFKFDTNKYTRHLIEGAGGNYVFDNTILTDGVGVSVLQIRNDRVGMCCKSNSSKTLQIIEQDVPYLCDLSVEERLDLFQNYIIVGGDPGKNDIIYLIDNKGNTLRYTQQQRAVECRFKKNKRAMVRMKKTTTCKDGRTVEAIEQELACSYNKKSCLQSNTRHYITNRRRLENLVYDSMYVRDTLRKLRYSAKSHTAQSEDRFLNKIVDTFQQNDKNGILIAWGNWGQKPNLKNCVSTPGVGFRKTISRKGRHHLIKVARENEMRTSCTCNDCYHRTDYCKKRYFVKNGVMQTRNVHGLLRCQNESCSRRWNRNVLGATNILEVAYANLQNLERPAHFQLAHALEGTSGVDVPENDGLPMNFTVDGVETTVFQ